MFTALLVAAGVAVFVGLRATVHDLDHSLDRFYERTHFADLTVIGGDADVLAREAAEVRGVQAVNTRGTTTLSVFIRNGTTKVQGTVIGVPARGPTINDVSITSGRDFAPDTSRAVAVVEQHTADDLDIAPDAGEWAAMFLAWAANLHEIGMSTLAVGPSAASLKATVALETPAIDERLAPIVNVVPLQWLALEVSRRLDVDADSFRKQGRYAAAQSKFSL